MTVFSDFVLDFWLNFPHSCFLLFSIIIPFLFILFSSMHPCFLHFCSPFPDEQCEAATSSPKPHPFPAAVWGAGKQPASWYPGRKRSLRWGQEEPLFWPLAGAGAVAGKLHERRLTKCPVIWLWPQFSLQGEDRNADNYTYTVCSLLSLQWQGFNI